MRPRHLLARSASLTLLLAFGGKPVSAMALHGAVRNAAAPAAPHDTEGGQPGTRSDACEDLVLVPFPLSLSFLFAMDAALRDAHMLLSKMQAMAFGAAQGNLSILELSIMDAQFQSLLEQVDRATYLASFDGIRLLNGGADVCLEGRPPTHRLLLHDTPDATSNAFGFCQLNVSLPSHALVALASVSNALRWIGVFRFEARQELWLLLR